MSPAWEGEERDEHGRWSSGGGNAGPPVGPNELAPTDRPEDWGYQNTAAETLSDANRDTDQYVEGRPVTTKQYEAWRTWVKTGKVDDEGNIEQVGFRQINETLREEGTAQQVATADQKVQIGSSIQHLDRYIDAQNPIARDITVYRAVSGEAAEAYGSLGTNDVVQEPSFVATTMSEHTAERFLGAQAPQTTEQFRGFYGGNPTEGQVMRIDVPEGTKVLAPEAAVTQTSEALLPRGGTLTNLGPMHFRYGAP